MNRKLGWALGITLLFVLLAIYQTRIAPPEETLSIEAQEGQAGPRLIAQDPIEGQRLDLSPIIRITFDREMDRTATARAFSLFGPDHQPVSGQVTWRDPRTIEFKPGVQLQPAAGYQVVISTLAAALDGASLPEQIVLQFKTIDRLAVGQVFPAPDAGDVDGTTSITAIFNRPVVPLAIWEEQADLPQPLEFLPAVAGHGEWVSSSVYVYQPDQPLLSGTRYTVRIDSELKDVNGSALDELYIWQFATRFPAIANIAMLNGPLTAPENTAHVRLDQAFVVAFTQPMDAASVAKAVTLADRESGRPFPVRLSWNEEFTALTIAPSGKYKIAGFYNLDIAGTALAKDGGRLKEGASLRFGTVPLPQIVKVSPEANSAAVDFDPGITVQFASPMRFEGMQGKVQISPAPAAKPQFYYNDYDQSLWIYGLEPATEYVVRILPGMADIYGNTIKTEYSFSFKTGDMPPYANLAMPWTPLVYRAKGPQEVYFEYNNVDAAAIQLYKLTYEEFSTLLNTGKPPTGFQPQNSPLREWTLNGKAARNHINVMHIELEDPRGNALLPGYYFIGVKADIPFRGKGSAPGSSAEFARGSGRPAGAGTDPGFHQAGLFVVATDNITFKATSSEALAWIVDLESGLPQAGVQVTFYDEHLKELGRTTTDRDGLAYVDKIQAPIYARAEGGSHTAFTALNWGSGVWTGDFGIYESYYGPPGALFGYVYTDRPVYRPGQDVYFKGIVRSNDDLHYSLPKAGRAYIRITNSNGEEVFADYLAISDQGSFNGSFKLAGDAALGSYNISASGSASPSEAVFGAVGFRVAEYHKPEFRVDAGPISPEALLGEKLLFALDAAYYSGGAVGDAGVDWFMESAPYYFEPAAKYSKFSFMDWDRDIYRSPDTSTAGSTLAEGHGATDAGGHFDLSQTVDLGRDRISQQVTFSANVTDAAGNLVSGQGSLIVHQSRYYVGIRSGQYIGQQGREQPFEVVVLDWGSNPVADQRVTVSFTERRWYSVQQQDKQGQVRWVTSVKEVPAGRKSVVTGEDGTASVSFVPPRGGTYKAVVTVTDPQGRSHSSSAYIWVTSEEYVPWRQTNDRTFNLIADKDTYAPGDTAELLIAQPFQGDMYALVTYERGHIYKQEVVLLKGNSTVYKIPVTADMAPNIYVSAVVVRGAAVFSPGSGQVAGKPDFTIGMTRLNVDTSRQTLDVQVTADKSTAGPGEKVTYTIVTRDGSGKPVPADVSLAVVDKAALALAPSNSAPILDSFYSAQGLGVQTALGLVSSADDFNEQYRESIPEGGGAGGGGGGDLGIITVRQDFKDTAAFRGQLTTDASGTAHVTIELPQNLTTWVADARAATLDSKVGQTTQELVSTKPVFVELQTPRFFVAGDLARIGATVHNNTDRALPVRVSLDAQGLELETDAAQTVEVPAKGQAYVAWDAAVASAASRVDLTARASSGSFEDASKPALGTLSDQGLPVLTYSAAETVGTSGLLTAADSATESIRLPTSLDYVDAELSVEMAPSLAASLQNSLTFLEDYPYLCMEQTISRFLPNVVTSRALKAAGLPAVTLQSDLDAQVSTALQRIYAKQHSDGGWNWWNGQESDPYTSAYVVLGLLEAKDAGYPVSGAALSQGTTYLKTHLPDLRTNESSWQYNRHAFMLYVLARAGQLGAGQTNFIYEQRASLDLYGEAYLAQAIHLLDPEDERLTSVMSDLETAAVLSASGAHWEEAQPDYWNWNTDTRTTAIVLNALVQIDPQNDLNAKGVRWLMAHREAGHWHTTQETAWTLMALTGWMSASQEYDTSYQYAIGLNGDLLEQGRTSREKLAETVRLQIELKDLIKESANYLVFTRGEGTGNLYYTAYLRTTLPIESVEPLDQGMTLLRQYFTLDDPKKPVTEVRRGDLVRVRLTMVLSESMHFLVVDDPLPAGFEAVDSTLATDTAVPASYTVQDFDERGWGWWYFPNIELHDEKVTLSADYLPAGTYVYTYLARASTAGTFKVIPPTAFEFYFPDVGGRGAGSVFVVKP